MQFWIRHIVLLLLCVVAPFGLALWLDTDSQLTRATESGSSEVLRAKDSLDTLLLAEAHQSVSSVISTAQKLSEKNIFADLGRTGTRGEEAFKLTQQALSDILPPGGFVWAVDGEGQVLVKHDSSAKEEQPRVITAHPLFAMAQKGLAGDGLWDDADKVVVAAAAPITQNGVTNGAILVGRPIQKDAVKRLATRLHVSLSLLKNGKLIHSSLEAQLVQPLIEKVGSSVEPVQAGRFTEAFEASVPGFPLLIDAYADGVAFTSLTVGQKGDSGTRWMISVPSGQMLSAVASRQTNLLGALAASLMLAILVGLINYRTFVKPLDKLAEHLSEIQLGRGEQELPEGKVPRPFRRLVRLINMTVQKIPARGLTPMGGTPSADSLSSISSAVVPAPAPPKMNFNDVLSQDSSPAPVAPVPQQAVDKEESSAVADAIASLKGAPAPTSSGSNPPVAEDEDGHAAAIAEAIAALETNSSGAAQAESPGEASGAHMAPRASSRSASAIRGISLDSFQGDEFDEVSQFSKIPSREPSAVGGGIRGGGSLSLDGHAGLGSPDAPAATSDYNPEATVVAPVAEDLLARSAREDLTDHHAVVKAPKPDMTVVATVRPDLLAQSATGEQNGADSADAAHFKEVYEDFIEMRRKCGEATADLAFDRFLSKLTRNRNNLIKKYNCRTVRFQVYEKDGKAALKATPVRAR